MTIAPANREVTLGQFNRLMRELIRGNINRNTFQPWEIELLLDIEDCRVRESARDNVLRRYQKAVQRQLERDGATMPIKLSEFLHRRR
jgi:hypothetical protein